MSDEEDDMAIGPGSLVEIALVQTPLSQEALNVYQYVVDTYPGTVSAANLAEGWWDHVKDVYRALATPLFGGVFLQVKVRELNVSAGQFADWDIPIIENSGTRSAGVSPDFMPPFASGSIKLNVETRATRPGHKRIPYMLEQDQSQGYLEATYLGLLTNLADVVGAQFTLGAPALGVVMRPIVCRKNPAGTVTVHQPVINAGVSNVVTTQNTRKYGRGV